jgi:hypothetical protein
MDETFLLSNMAPQVGDGFNRHCAPAGASAAGSELTAPQTGRTSRTGAAA